MTINFNIKMKSFDIVGFLYCVGRILLKHDVIAIHWTRCPRYVSTTF